MESRLSGRDVFLNQKIDGKDGNELISLLPDDTNNSEELVKDLYDNKSKKNWLNRIIETLSEREEIIIKSRKLKEKSITLDELEKILKINKKKVRQIETRTLFKLKKAILDVSQQKKEFFI